MVRKLFKKLSGEVLSDARLEGVKAEQIKTDAKILNISVTSDNQILWEDSILESNNLEQFFSQHSKDFPDGLLILADDDSEHGTIVKVMDSARNTGITSISLARN